MNLLQTLEDQLKKEPNYVTDNGELKKWVVVDKARAFDEELLGYLLEEPILKETFFKTVHVNGGGGGYSYLIRRFLLSF